MNAELLWQALETVSDPEYPVSVVDLGMIYDLRLNDAGVADVDLTFTSVGCPAIEMIPEDIRAALEGVTGVTDVTINVVWSPPWSKDRITPRGRRILEMHGVVS